MYKISESTARIVATDVQGAVKGIDQALLDVARCSVTLLEAASEVNLPIANSQGILRAVHESASHVLDARENFAKAINRLNVVKRDSNVDTKALGCPGPTPINPWRGKKEETDAIQG